MELRTLKNSPQTFPEVPKQKKKLTSSVTSYTRMWWECLKIWGPTNWWECVKIWGPTNWWECLKIWDQLTGENVLKYGDQLVRMSQNMRPTGENVWKYGDQLVRMYWNVGTNWWECLKIWDQLVRMYWNVGTNWWECLEIWDQLLRMSENMRPTGENVSKYGTDWFQGVTHATKKINIPCFLCFVFPEFDVVVVVFSPRTLEAQHHNIPHLLLQQQEEDWQVCCEKPK